jgi:hypothetical protein
MEAVLSGEGVEGRLKRVRLGGRVDLKGEAGRFLDFFLVYGEFEVVRRLLDGLGGGDLNRSGLDDRRLYGRRRRHDVEQGGFAGDLFAALVVEMAGFAVDVEVAQGSAMLVGLDGVGFGDPVEQLSLVRGEGAMEGRVVAGAEIGGGEGDDGVGLRFRLRLRRGVFEVFRIERYRLGVWKLGFMGFELWRGNGLSAGFQVCGLLSCGFPGCKGLEIGFQCLDGLSFGLDKLGCRWLSGLLRLGGLDCLSLGLGEMRALGFKPLGRGVI